MPKPTAQTTRVIVESGTKRVFASALDWPGWCRSGRDEAGALDALAAYASRYQAVAKAAHLRFPAAPAFDVVERLRGGGATDFGVPDVVAEVERQPLSRSDARRLASLVEACWVVFDEIVANASPILRKGPRGGGRDRDEVVQHVLSPESGSYARAIGLRLTNPLVGDQPAITASRAAIAEALRGGGGQDAQNTKWPIRYAARRIAWHVMDHAWEIQDKSETEGCPPSPR